MTLSVRFQCDRCERIKDVSYTNPQQLAGGYNLEIGGLKYYLCDGCEFQLGEWMTLAPPEVRNGKCFDNQPHDAHFMFMDRAGKRVECIGVPTSESVGSDNGSNL